MALGRRQIEILRRFSGGAKFAETRNGEPWSVMKALAKRGLMWIEKRDLEYWYDNEWRSPRTEWWAGLTTDGRQVLKEIGP